MSKRRFSELEVLEILGNPNVANCSEKSISYGREFKQLAVKKYRAGMSAREIFIEAGFNLSLIGGDIPDSRLGRWRKIFEARGLNGLAAETRGRHHHGGRPRTKGLTDADKIKKMEIEIAYLKAENDFLAKLRAAKKR